MTQLELIDIDSELGVILPDEILSRLGASAGNELVLAETPFGYLLTAAKVFPEGSEACHRR